jgi:hypothetical protein
MRFKISAILGTDTINDLKNKLNEVKAALPFLLKLSSADRHGKRNLGHKSVGYGKSSLQVAKKHLHLMQRQFEVEEFESDVLLYEQLQDFLMDVSSLHQNIEDTVIVLGQKIMEQSNEVYAEVKRAAKKDNTYKAAMNELSAFYRKSKNQKKLSVAPDNTTDNYPSKLEY